MSPEEANNYLFNLQYAGAVTLSELGIVDFTPDQTVNSVLLRTGLPPLATCIPAVEKRKLEIDTLVNKEKDEIMLKIRSVQMWRKRFWGATTLFSATQMFTLSYLTFIVYGWDVMEPICYFITTATALASCAYFLYFRKTHSYEHLDDAMLQYLLAKEFWNSEGQLRALVKCATTEQELCGMSLDRTLSRTDIIQEYRKNS